MDANAKQTHNKMTRYSQIHTRIFVRGKPLNERDGEKVGGLPRISLGVGHDSAQHDTVNGEPTASLHAYQVRFLH